MKLCIVCPGGSQNTIMKHKPNLHPQESQTQSQLRVEYLPLRSLQPAKRNPKKHQIATVLASMSRFGYVSPMILDERTGRLVAGHGRLESLLKAKSEGQEPPDRIRVQQGDWLVPVVRGIAFADDQQAEAFLLADNQTAIVAGWDDRELKKIIDELGRDEALLDTGFEDLYHEEFGVEQDDPALLIDRAAELHKKWQTAHGQLWEIGTHRLLCGDSTSETDVRLLMTGKRACLFATDPPCLVDYNGSNHPHKWTKSHGHNHPGDKN
jgi:hypothetical protein